MSQKIFNSLIFFSLIVASSVVAGIPPVGAAPKGDPKVIASRIIKYNFPECRNISRATRMQDGSIRANCDSVDYMVFTVFNAKEGRTLEIALNCTAAKALLKVSC